MVDGVDEALHGLDAARRAGWARAYSAEEALAEAEAHIEHLTQRVHGLAAALHWTMSFTVEGEDRTFHSPVDWCEAIVAGNQPIHLLDLARIAGYDDDRVEGIITKPIVAHRFIIDEDWYITTP